MEIEVHHPDAGDALLVGLAGMLERLGARVVVEVGEDNLVRRIGAEPRVLAFADDLAQPCEPRQPPAVEVKVAGLPNLLHEAVHVVLAERLDDDHGIDYGAIPFDLRTAQGRAVLWEELACCVVSCAYVLRPVGTEDPSSAWARTVGWFREQVEIQPIFYGYEDDPTAFWSVVRACHARRRGEAEAVIERAYRRIEVGLRERGLQGAAVPLRRLGLDELLEAARTPRSCVARREGVG